MEKPDKDRKPKEGEMNEDRKVEGRKEEMNEDTKVKKIGVETELGEIGVYRVPGYTAHNTKPR